MLNLNRRMLGVHENAKPAQTAARFPGACWERLFVSDDGRPLPESTSAAMLTKLALSAIRGWTDGPFGVVLSVKLDMAQVARGVWDERLGTLAQALEPLRVVLVVSHEQENDTPARVSLDGTNRAYDVVKAAAPDLTFATADMVYAWSLKKAKPDVRVSAADAKLRAKRKTDLALADCYFGRTFPMGILPEHGGWARWFDVMQPARWGMGEIGWLLGPGRPEAIRRQADWFATDPVGRTCKAVLVWSTGGTENNPGWVLDEPARTEVAALIRRLDQPTGYRPSPVDGVLVHEATGALVAADLTGRWDAFTAR